MTGTATDLAAGRRVASAPRAPVGEAPVPTFGRILRSLRSNRRLSIRRTAALAGVAPSYLSRIETGKVIPPPERTIVRIARALHSDPEPLIALAARIPEDVSRKLARRPRLMAELIRCADHYSDDQLERLCRALGGENPPD